MIRDPHEVERHLRKRILEGYLPSYTNESACDHGGDWFQLTPERFAAVCRGALEELAAGGGGTSANAGTGVVRQAGR
jgi:hypothetical protein